MGSNNYGENPKNIAQKFCDAILNELKHKYSLKELVELFVECSPEIRKYVATKAVENPIQDIEKLVKKTESNRIKNPSKANEYGHNLYQNTSVKLQHNELILIIDGFRITDYAVTVVIGLSDIYIN